MSLDHPTRIIPAPSLPPVPVAVAVAVLHESERTRVSREFLPTGSVIRKQPLGPDAERRLHHELAILDQLRGVEGVGQVAAAPPRPGSIALADVDGACLAHRSMPLDAAEVAGLALELARTLAGVHGRRVVHRDIQPANILLAGARARPYLVDFARATTFGEIRPEFTHHTAIVGNLAYLAPEQTGRMGRPVDQRADLYSLGATLYEVATGQPPFGRGDPLRLSHDHLARVPVPPDQVNPAIPPTLSRIVMRLLEKEPDRRYQTAAGLVHDLTRLQHDPVAAFPLGECDFPLRLLPPSRLVGRDVEVAALGTALADAAAGACRGVLVSGGPGVGKTVLIDQLRPMVTASDGWFVAGRFDRHRQDQAYDAVWQAFHSLGRLLLAEPEEKLTELRERMLAALGPNAGLLAAIHPEYATLLGVAPDRGTGDPLTVEPRLHRAGVDVLRVVAARKRPVVLAVDELQWAGRTPLGFVDTVLGGEDVAGLLLVGAYRDDEVDETHPLRAMLSRWRREPEQTRHIRLSNLPQPSLTALVGETLRLDPAVAAPLARAIAPYTKGNPSGTVELLNTLRQDGVLTPGDGGWRWDAAALRRRLGAAGLDELVAERSATMPPATLKLLQTIACLDGRVGWRVLRAASGASASGLEHRLALPLDAGLLVMEQSDQEPAVRFRHERVREVVLARLGRPQGRALRLRIARRLAQHPDLFAVAAEQYLPVVDAVRDPDERARVAALLARAAERAQLISNHVVVERCLAAAVRLTDPSERDTLVRLQTGRHTALYSLGRLDETDEVYQAIDRLCTAPAQRTDATLVQVSSLANRSRPREAVDLGLAQLAQLGLPVPPPERLDAEVEHGLAALYAWLDETSKAADLSRPEHSEPGLVGVAALINRILPPSFNCDQAVMAWLALTAMRLWREHGPSRVLIGPMAYVSFVPIARRHDYRTARRVMRRIRSFGEVRGYEPEASQARLVYTASIGPWFEPLEENVAQAHRAREALMAGGDLQNACYTYFTSVPQSLEYAVSLDAYVSEVEEALAFARRTGNVQAASAFTAYRRLIRVLRREGPESGSDGAEGPDPQGATPPVLASIHLTRALAAAILGDLGELSRHTAAVMPLLPQLPGTTHALVAHVLRAVAVASQIRAGAGKERRALLAELDAAMEWLAARAADAPANYLHLLRFVEAERAWAVGDFRAAAHAFDVAQREAASRQRPWHRALIFERAARLYIAQGLEAVGHSLLGEARQEYLDWGAAAKVDRLDWAYPTLQRPPVHRAGGRSGTMAGAIDLLGILTASQALSSEKSIDRLRSRVVEVLSAMTGATGVQLLVWNDDERRWFLAAPRGRGDVPLADAGRLVPLAAIRYAERIREPLVVVDATRDDRFSRDPYFNGMESCSLMVVPVVNRGMVQALLLLENRLIRGAFSSERLDSVMLIAAQLAVSLDNAIVYASLERKVAERTEELALANELLRLANDRLEQLSVTDPLTGLANRRQLEEVLDAECRRAQAVGSPISLLMLDIDHFKLYNDHYGHAAGDRCLQRVAAEVRRKVRKVDLAARYGGEEFAVVMPGVDVTGAVEVAERLRTAVAALGEPHELVTDRVITVSIGVAAIIPPQRGGGEHLVESADVELYRAKRSGRNRVRAALP